LFQLASPEPFGNGIVVFGLSRTVSASRWPFAMCRAHVAR
jgi:hypothetical protein